MEHKNDKTIEIILAVSNLKDRESRPWIFPTSCVKVARLVVRCFHICDRGSTAILFRLAYLKEKELALLRCLYSFKDANGEALEELPDIVSAKLLLFSKRRRFTEQDFSYGRL